MSSLRPAASLRERLMAGLVVPLVLWSLGSSALAYLLALHFTTQAYDRSLHASILDIERQIKLGQRRAGHRPAAGRAPDAGVERARSRLLPRRDGQRAAISRATPRLPAAADAASTRPDALLRRSVQRRERARRCRRSSLLPGYRSRSWSSSPRPPTRAASITRKILFATLAHRGPAGRARCSPACGWWSAAAWLRSVVCARTSHDAPTTT